MNNTDNTERYNIFYHLNTLGIQYKKDTINSCVTTKINIARHYFCQHFCKYSKYCECAEDKILPWCPVEEL